MVNTKQEDRNKIILGTMKLICTVFCITLVACVSNKHKSTIRIAKRAEISAPTNWSSPAKIRVKKKIGAEDFSWLDELGGKNLRNLTKKAWRDNPDLLSLRSRVIQARGALKVAGSGLFPLLNFNMEGSRNQRNFIGFPSLGSGDGGVVSSRSNSFGMNLNAQWELDIWGKNVAKRKAAKADYLQAAALWRAAHVSLAGQIAKTYLNYIASTKQIELSEEAMRSARDVEDDLRSSLGVDSGAAQLRIAMTDTETAKASLEQARIALRANARALQILIGEYPSGKVDKLIPIGTDLPNLPLKPPVALPLEILQKRPDLRAAKWRVIATDHRLREAKVQLLPAISLTGSTGYASEEFKELLRLSPEYKVWSIAGNLAQAIFAGGAISGGIESFNAQTLDALAAYKKAALQAFAEVEQGLGNEELLRARADALIKAEKLAEQAYQSARQDFNNGVSDRLTVISARTRFINIQTQALASKLALLENRVDLRVAVFGDFDEEAEMQPITIRSRNFWQKIKFLFRHESKNTLRN